jgi:hypothetical protein
MIKVVPTTSLSISLFLYIYIYQRGFSHGVASCACLNGRPIEGAGLIADDLGYVPFLGHLTPSCPPVNWRALRCWQHTAAYSGLCDTVASTCAIPGKRNRLNSRVARYPYIEGQACDDKSMHTIFFLVPTELHLCLSLIFHAAHDDACNATSPSCNVP